MIAPAADLQARSTAAIPPPRRAGAAARRRAQVAGRITAVDLFRGLTLAGIILVTSIKDFPEVRPVLHHSPWRGITIVDIGLPLMLFVVGVSAHLSVIARRARGESDGEITRHAAYRTVILVLLGIAGSTYPDFHFGTIQLTGILQSIGITYFVTTLLILYASVRVQVGVIAAILLGYWLVLALVHVPDSGLPGSAVFDRPSATLAAWVDRRILGAHMNRRLSGWDTEGILPTISWLSTVLMGALTARWLSHEDDRAARLRTLFAVGTLLGAAGFVWGWTYPIIKGLWTGSYVLVTAGAGILALATCIWLAGMPRIERYTRAFTALGRNALLVYAGFIIVGGALDAWRITLDHGPPVAAPRLLFEVLFASWLPARDALSAYACMVLGVWLAVAWVLQHRNIIIKV